MESVFSPIIDAVYVRKFFDNNSIPVVLDVFNNVRSSFQSLLTENDWMDEHTKEEALKKVRTNITLSLLAF